MNIPDNEEIISPTTISLIVDGVKSVGAEVGVSESKDHEDYSRITNNKGKVVFDLVDGKEYYLYVKGGTPQIGLHARKFVAEKD